MLECKHLLRFQIIMWSAKYKGLVRSHSHDITHWTQHSVYPAQCPAEEPLAPPGVQTFV